MSNRIKKCVILIWALCVFGASVCASELVDPNNASVIHTTWFDIIYNEPQEPTAQRLASFADDVYLQANHDMGVEPVDHLSVVVSGVTENINAYWSDFPYDHLVVFDAAPDIWDLASYEDTLRSVFYHELIHHVSLTMTDPDSNPVIRFLQRILYLAEKLNMSTGFAEGATVSKESQHQNGRLQNGYVLHTIVQAKAEGKAKRWESMSGVRDVQSIGSWAYYMGGAFARYLQDTYGDEKYTQWWQQSAHLDLGFTTHLFKKVYGRKLQDVWTEFYLTIPEVTFTDAFTATVSPTTERYGSFGSLTAVGGDEPGIAVFNFTNYALEFYPLKADSSWGKAKKWRTIDGSASGLAVNDEGTLYAVSSLAATTKDRYETRVYTRKGRQIGKAIPDMRFCTFITLADGTEAVAGVKTSGYRSVFAVIPVGTTEPLFTREFDFNDELYAVAKGPEQTAAVLEKTNGQWKVALYAVVDGSSEYEVLLPESVVPRYLSAVQGAEGRYLISVAGHTMDGGSAAVPGAIPRSAELVIEKDGTEWSSSLEIDTENVSGGLYNPVMTAAGTIAAIRKESDGSLLVTGMAQNRTALALATDSDSTGSEDSSAVSTVRTISEGSSDGSQTFSITKYNRYGYPLEGKLLPFDVYAYEPNITTMAELPSIGASWISSDPAESFYYLAGVGYYPFINQVTLNLNLSGDTGPIHWSAFTQYHYAGFSIANFIRSLPNLFWGGPVDTDPVSELYNNLYLTTGFYPGSRNWYQQFALYGSALENFTKKYTGTTVQLNSQLQHVVRKGSSIYETAGFALAVMPWDVGKYEWTSGKFYDIGNVSLIGIVKIPHLVPFQNPDYYTLNLPVTLKGQLLAPEVLQWYSDRYAGQLAAAQAEAILFSRELQTGIFGGLYANRVTLSATYGCAYYDYLNNWELLRLPGNLSSGSYNDAIFAQTATIDLYVVTSLAYGAFAQNPARIGVTATINLNDPEKYTVTFGYKMDSGDR